jgi:hypothetical protein
MKNNKNSETQPEKLPLSIKILNWLKANFIAVIVTGIVIPTAYWLIPAPHTKTFTAAIQVVDWKGENNPAINQSGSKISILNKEAKSIADGKVEFGDIPAKYKNKPVKINFLPAPDYEYLYIKDTEITLTNHSEIKVYMKGLDKLNGTITCYETGKSIDNAKIEINGEIVCSDSLGNFSINLSIGKQEREQFIKISKAGYEIYRKEKDMVTNSGLNEFKLHLKPD